MAEFKVHAREHPVITGAIIGVIVGYFYHRFWWFRLAVLLTLFYFCATFTYDWMFTERTLPANTSAVQFSAEVVKKPNFAWSDQNLTYTIEYRVENVYDQTIDHLTIVSELYDCPDMNSATSQCKLLKTKAWMPGIDLAPGQTWTQKRTFTFDNAERLISFPRVEFSYRNVVVDSDNTGREPR